MSTFTKPGLVLAFIALGGLLSLLPAAAVWATDHSAPEQIETAGLLEHISTLASDEFGGRAPMSEGERLRSSSGTWG